MPAHVLAVSEVGLRALEGRGAPPPPPLFVHYDLPVRKVRVSLDWLPSSRAGWVQSAFKVQQALLRTAVWPPALKTPWGIDATHALCRVPWHVRGVVTVLLLAADATPVA